MKALTWIEIIESSYFNDYECPYGKFRINNEHGHNVIFIVSFESPSLEKRGY